MLLCQQDSFFRENIRTFFDWQQYSSVCTPTHGEEPRLTSRPAVWLWSKMSGSAPLCSSPSVGGKWWRVRDYKAGTVTQVAGLMEEKAAGLESSSLEVCGCIQATFSSYGSTAAQASLRDVRLNRGDDVNASNDVFLNFINMYNCLMSSSCLIFS